MGDLSGPMACLTAIIRKGMMYNAMYKKLVSAAVAKPCPLFLPKGDIVYLTFVKGGGEWHRIHEMDHLASECYWREESPNRKENLSGGPP